MKLTIFILFTVLVNFCSGQKRTVLISATNEAGQPVEDYFIQVNNLKGDSVAGYHALTHLAVEIELPDTATCVVHAWKKGYLRFVKSMPLTKLTGKETMAIIFKPVGAFTLDPIEFMGTSGELSAGQRKHLEGIAHTFFLVQHQSKLEVTLVDGYNEKGQGAALRRIKITEILKKEGCDLTKVHFIKTASPKQPGAFVTNDKKPNAKAVFKILNA